MYNSGISTFFDCRQGPRCRCPRIRRRTSQAACMQLLPTLAERRGALSNPFVRLLGYIGNNTAEYFPISYDSLSTYDILYTWSPCDHHRNYCGSLIQPVQSPPVAFTDRIGELFRSPFVRYRPAHSTNQIRRGDFIDLYGITIKATKVCE